MFLLSASKHHLANSTNVNSDSCETSPVRRNVTLRGGIKAGYFRKLAQYVAMELCVQLCCQEKGCDVAFMIGKNCYGVKCFSEELCHVVPAKNAPRALLISKVDFRGEGISTEIHVLHLTITYFYFNDYLCYICQ